MSSSAFVALEHQPQCVALSRRVIQYSLQGTDNFWVKSFVFLIQVYMQILFSLHKSRIIF